MSDKPAESVTAFSTVEREGIYSQLTAVFEQEPSVAGLKAWTRAVEVPLVYHEELQVMTCKLSVQLDSMLS